MSWISRLAWLAVSLYGSWLIGRHLLQVFHRRLQRQAFTGGRFSLTRLRLGLAGLWVLASAAWTFLLWVIPLPVPPAL